jgi:hypothetical protein
MIHSEMLLDYFSHRGTEPEPGDVDAFFEDELSKSFRIQHWHAQDIISGLVRQGL